MEQASSNTIIDSQAFSALKLLVISWSATIIHPHRQQENAVAAGFACLRSGASLEDIKKELPQPESQVVWKFYQKNGAKVFVDYAHNGVSLSNLLVPEEHHGQDYPPLCYRQQVVKATQRLPGLYSIST